jgi:hypothetical protein
MFRIDSIRASAVLVNGIERKMSRFILHTHQYNLYSNERQNKEQERCIFFE